MSRWYSAGADYHPGTNLPANVTGECPHRHRTPEAAQRCIDQMSAAISRGHGNAYCDRVVMVEECGGNRHHYGAQCESCGTVQADYRSTLYEPL